MNIFEMGAAIAACDAAMIKAGVPALLREATLEHFARSLAVIATAPPREKGKPSSLAVLL